VDTPVDAGGRVEVIADSAATLYSTIANESISEASAFTDATGAAIGAIL